MKGPPPMLTYREETAVQRWFVEAEVALLRTGSAGAALDRLRGTLDAQDADNPYRHRLEALTSGGTHRPPPGYAERWGYGGIRAFTSSAGLELFQISIRTFPEHDTLCYYIDRPEPTLIDVGSGLPSTRDDWADRLEVLDRVFGIPDPRHRLRHMIVSHGHIDHYGYLPRLLEEVRPEISVHELDARVLEQFDERIVLAAQDLDRFLAGTGLSDGSREQLMGLFRGAKDHFRPVPVDVRLRQGSVVPGGGRVIHTPGHCPGLICIRFDDLLYTADHLLQHITPHQSPQALNPFFGLENYFSSLQKVAAVDDIRTGLPAHGPLIHDIRGRVHEILYFHQRRLAQVLELCETPRSLVEISRDLFGEFHGYSVILGLEEAAAHVEYLHQHGWLRVTNLDAVDRGETRVLRYRLDPEAIKRRKEPSVSAQSPEVD